MPILIKGRKSIMNTLIEKENNNVEQVLLYSKPAKYEETQEDNPTKTVLKLDNELKEFLKKLTEHTLGENIPFINITPNNTSIKTWISNLKNTYPQPYPRDVNDLLNTFRESLNSSSKQSKYNVCLILYKDLIILYHTKQTENLLDYDSIFRAGIIKTINNRILFSAYEKNRKWSKGHAKFWGIHLENLKWSNISDIILQIKLENFQYPLHLPLENNEIKNMILEENIKSDATIQIGTQTGIINKINLYGKNLTFNEFYQYYIDETQELNKHTEFYNTLIPITPTLDNYTHNKTSKTYIEDEKYIYKNKISKENRIHTKNHNKYTLTFTTSKYPGIKPNPAFLGQIYESIFTEKNLNLIHVGEAKSSTPLEIGNLKIYNQIKIDPEFKDTTKYLIKLIQKINPENQTILKDYYLTYLNENLKNHNLETLFTILQTQITKTNLEKEFENKKLEKNKYVKYESQDAINTKPQEFAKIIKKHVKKSIKKDKLLKYAIIYGIEKNGHIKPTQNYNPKHLELVEKETNKLLQEDKLEVTTNIREIKTEKGTIIIVYILPTII
jgi:hypothetical protein